MDKSQEKFNITPMEANDWDELTNKLYEQWHHLLDADLDTTCPGQWIGFYMDGMKNIIFVIQCVNDFALPCMQLHHLSIPLPVQCFRLAPTPDVLGSGKIPSKK